MSELSQEKRKPGGQLGNANAAKKPDVWLPENLDYLNSAEDCLAFQKRVIHELHTGKLGARQAGAINHALETLLKFYLDSKKLKQQETQLARIMGLLPAEIKAKVEADMRNEA
jgi:hypothetical protein